MKIWKWEAFGGESAGSPGMDGLTTASTLGSYSEEFVERLFRSYFLLGFMAWVSLWAWGHCWAAELAVRKNNWTQSRAE